MSSSPRRNVAVAVVVMHEGMMLLLQRKVEGVLREFWEFPFDFVAPYETLDDAALSILRESTGIVPEGHERLGIIDNPYTTVDIIVVYGARMPHQAVPKASLSDIDSITWAAPSMMPVMAPNHMDMMHIYLASTFR